MSKQMAELKELLQKVESKVEGKGFLPDMNTADKIAKLKEFQANHAEEYEFKAGDLIVAKEGFEAWKTVKDGNILIITEVLEVPKFGYEFDSEESSCASPYGAKTFDIIAGFIDNSGELLMHFYDSSHFKPYEN